MLEQSDPAQHTIGIGNASRHGAEPAPSTRPIFRQKVTKISSGRANIRQRGQLASAGRCTESPRTRQTYGLARRESVHIGPAQTALAYGQVGLVACHGKLRERRTRRVQIQGPPTDDEIERVGWFLLDQRRTPETDFTSGQFRRLRGELRFAERGQVQSVGPVPDRA